MRDCYVHAVGLWRPGVPDFPTWQAGRIDEQERSPAAGLLAGPLKRRASLLTRMAIEVYAQAASSADAKSEEVMSVWAIAHGEIHTAVALLEMMHTGEGKLSPTKFHNSVYNTASGYASIATHDRAPSTTISGGTEIVGAALLEAIGQLDEHGGETIVVWADEPLPSPFSLPYDAEPLAVALRLSFDPSHAVARLSNLHRDANTSAEMPERKEFYIAAILPLLTRIVRRESASIELEAPRTPNDPTWKVDIRFDV